MNGCVQGQDIDTTLTVGWTRLIPLGSFIPLPCWKMPSKSPIMVPALMLQAPLGKEMGVGLEVNGTAEERTWRGPRAAGIPGM